MSVQLISEGLRTICAVLFLAKPAKTDSASQSKAAAPAMSERRLYCCCKSNVAFRVRRLPKSKRFRRFIHISPWPNGRTAGRSPAGCGFAPCGRAKFMRDICVCLYLPVSLYAGVCGNGLFPEGLGCVISSIYGRAVFPHSIPKPIRGISPYAGRAAARLSSRVSVGHFIFTCRGCEGVIFEGVRRMLAQLLSNHFRALIFIAFGKADSISMPALGDMASVWGIDVCLPQRVALVADDVHGLEWARRSPGR